MQGTRFFLFDERRLSERMASRWQEEKTFVSGLCQTHKGGNDMNSEERLFLFWITIGIVLILAILIYQLVNYIILKRRWRRFFKRMERSFARASEAFNQVMMATNDATAAAKRFGEIVMAGFSEEVGFQCGHWIKKNLPKFIKEIEKNERTRKDGNGRTSQGEPTKH